MANAIARELEKCGLAVTVNSVTADKLVNNLRWGKYDLFLGQTRLSANMDLSAFFHQSGTLNYGGLADPAAYAMCLEALANSGNYYSLHKLVMENGLLCPVLMHSYAIYGARGIAPGLTPARECLFYYDLGLTLADIRISGS